MRSKFMWQLKENIDKGAVDANGIELQVKIGRAHV